MTPIRSISAPLVTLMMVVTGATSALAPTGLEHATSLASGFLHPLTGPDHVPVRAACGVALAVI
jgi:hydrogenase/urease accessory protein HupE